MYGALRPAAALKRYLASFTASAAERAGPRWTAVHLRIERDWWFRAAMCHRQGPRRCFSPVEVARTTRRTRRRDRATGSLLMYARA